MKKILIALGLLATLALESCAVRVGGYNSGYYGGYRPNHYGHHHHGYYYR